MLAGAIRRGGLLVIWPDGTQSHYGNVTTGTQAGIRIGDNATLRRLVLNPGLAVGECYMDGTLVPVNSSIHDVLVVLMDNSHDYQIPVVAFNTRLLRIL